MTALSQIVIAGAGQAGLWCAKELRAADFAGEITLIGDEPYPPYDRPPLSKAVLTGKATVESTYYLTPEQLQSLGIAFRPGERVTGIDRSHKQVSLGNNDRLAYDHLVIATGARVREVTIPGANSARILYLRGIDDCLVLQREIVPDRRVIVLGGGLIGLEVAAAACKFGARVTVIEVADRVMARIVGDEVSQHFEALHRRNGVEIRTRCRPLAIRPHATGLTVECEGGLSIEGDLIIAGIGVIPNDEIAREAGLKTGNGIWTDAFCHTDDPDISAIGDVANQLAPRLGRRVRLETWQNAKSQGAYLARNLCGLAKPYDDNPWGWSDQFGTNLQMLGLPERMDGGILRRGETSESFSVFYLRGGRVEGVVAVNAVRDVAASRRLMAEGRQVAPRILGDSSVPLKALLQGTGGSPA